MAFIVWDEGYSTGIDTIDNQHKHLISLLNRMLEALLQKRGKEEVSYVIDEMSRYVEYHFHTEESLMEKAGYPELAEHRIFHDGFTSKVNDFAFKYNQNDEALCAEVTIFLTNWLIEHLSTIDQKYVPALKKAGII